MEDLDTNKKYVKCKAIVCKWERDFKKKYGHNPGKADIKKADSYIRYAYKTYFYWKTSYLLENTLEVPDDDNLNDSTSQNVSLNQSVDVNEDKSQRFDVIQRYLESTSIESPEIPENDLGISTIKGKKPSKTHPGCSSTHEGDGDILKCDIESSKLSESTVDHSLNIDQSIESPIKCVDDIIISHNSKADKVSICKSQNHIKEDVCSEKSVSNSQTEKIANIDSFKENQIELKKDDNITKNMTHPVITSIDSNVLTMTNFNDTEKLPSDENTGNTVTQSPPNHESDKVWGAHLNKSATQKTPDAISKKSNIRSKKVLERSASFNLVTKLFDGSKFKKRNPRRSLNKTLSTSSMSFDLSSQVNKSHEENNTKVPDVNTDKSNETILVKDKNNEMEIDPLEDKVDIKITKQVPSVLLSHKNESNLLIKVENKTINTKLNSKWIERCDTQIREENKKFVKNVSLDSGVESTNSQITNESQANEQSTTAGTNEAINANIASNSEAETNQNKNTNDTQAQEDSEAVGLNMSNEKLLAMFNSSYEKTLQRAAALQQNTSQESMADEKYDTDEDCVLNSESEDEMVSRSLTQNTSSSNLQNRSCSNLSNQLNRTKSLASRFAEKSNSTSCLPSYSSVVPNRETSIEELANKSLMKDVENNIENKGKRKADEIEDTEEKESKISKIIKKIRNEEKSIVRRSERSKKTKQDVLEDKVHSGVANDNYVKININKKIYARGKKTFTFSKFKKQQWKSKKKMNASGDSGGSGVVTCFKCGDVGHWARNCLQSKDLLPMEEAEDMGDDTFLSLQEAEEVAKDAALLAHRNKIQTGWRPKDLHLPSDEILSQVVDEPQGSQKYASVEPLFSLKADGSLPDTPHEVLDALDKFGHKEFRHGQEKAIMRVLSGQSTLVTLATGSGKSLCYQLPAYLYAQRSKCITLVISPLVSLMDDQIDNVPRFLKAAALHTNMTTKARGLVMDRLKSQDVSILIVSPEAIVSNEKMYDSGFLQYLPPIAFACIDEVHCVSQWSHNFRPSYLVLCQVLKQKLGISTLLGLTATCTQLISRSIVSSLSIDDPDQGIITNTPLPDNLILSVSKDKEKDQALIKLISSPIYKELDSIIIYCTRREQCTRVASFIRTVLQHTAPAQEGRLSAVCEAYHAGLTGARRKQVQTSFMSGKTRIVVATVAFGMGINKADIRAVIHHNMPKNFENYVQEVGRAGRDGKPAFCHLFLDSEGNDINELRKHIYANTVDRLTIRKLLERVFIKCSCTGFCRKHEVAFSIKDTIEELDLPEENILTLLCYLELHEKKWIQVLSPVYTHCRVQCYKGARALRNISKQCPPLAVAIAMELNRNNTDPNKLTCLEFSIMKLAETMGWDSGILKSQLKNAEWTKENDKPKKSGILVEFSELGFRVKSPGNLSEEALDETLNSLHGIAVSQEQTGLSKLYAVCNALNSVSYRDVAQWCNEATPERSNTLKSKIRRYFQDENDVDATAPEVKLTNEDLLMSDIQSLVYSHRDTNFTGRSIARIFHGIPSPNFPAIIFGRNRYWRSHMDQDFGLLCKLAARELIRLR